MRPSYRRATINPLVPLVLCLFAATTQVSVAQPYAPAKPAAQAGGPPLCNMPAVPPSLQPPSRNDQKKSADHLHKAQQAYVSRDFNQAIWHLQAAYALIPHPEVLYNLAQACREAGSDVEA